MNYEELRFQLAYQHIKNNDLLQVRFINGDDIIGVILKSIIYFDKINGQKLNSRLLLFPPSIESITSETLPIKCYADNIEWISKKNKRTRKPKGI